MKKFLITFILFVFLIVTSCTSNDVEEMDPPLENGISYSQNVKSIIDSNCNSCHSNPVKFGAPMSLTTLQNVKDAISDRGLIGRIEDGSMPPGGKLTDAQIKIIKDWQTDGFKK